MQRNAGCLHAFSKHCLQGNSLCKNTETNLQYMCTHANTRDQNKELSKGQVCVCGGKGGGGGVRKKDLSNKGELFF